MLPVGLALLLIIQPAPVKNPGCKIPATAEALCDTSYDLWDLSQRLDRALDVCKIEKRGLEGKLQTVTATTVMHTHTVEVPKVKSGLDEAIEYVGAGLLILGGFGLGYLAFH